MYEEIENIRDLIIKHIRGELTPSEQEQLEKWVNASEDNKRLFAQSVDHSWLYKRLNDCDRFEQEKEEFWLKVQTIIEDESGSHRPVLKNMRWLRYAAAAAIIIGIAFFLLPSRKTDTGNKVTETKAGPVTNDVAPGKTKATLSLADGREIVLDSSTVKPGQAIAKQGNTDIVSSNGQLVYTKRGNDAPEVLYNILTTAKGDTYGTILSDGTRIWLNAGSSIRYPVSFAGSKRHVEITGEAYFEVAPDPNKPFTVSVKGMSVTVLGTHFNINAYDDEPAIKATLLEGHIQVGFGTEKLVLQPGEQAKADSAGTVRKIKNADLDEVTAWRKGRFYFKRSDVGAVVRQLIRWYNIDVKYEGGKPTQLFDGELERNLNLSQVVRALGHAGIQCRIEGNTLYVRGS